MEHITSLRKHVSVKRACESLQVARSSYYACLHPPTPTVARPRPRPARALSEEQQNEAMEILTSEAFVDKAPASIVAGLLDQGRYVCCTRTFYRVLALMTTARDRRNTKRATQYHKPELMATKPRQVWTWDITKLKGPRKGVVYNLYVVLDMFSRFVVGWLLAEREQDDYAHDLIDTACERESICRDHLTIHADNGGVMRSNTVSELFDKLGVRRSHSRPYCSNDNPYSESQFKTLKYSAGYPERFESIEAARAFIAPLMKDYNDRMYHSGLAMLTPAMVHYGKADVVIEQRQRVLKEAFEKHPERFVKGLPQHKQIPEAVWINKPEKDPTLVVNS